MDKTVRKLISISIILVWTFLFGFQCLESFGYFKNTAEHQDQTVEQAFAVPIENNHTFTQSHLPLFKKFESLPLVRISAPCTTNFQELVLSSSNQSPPKSPTPLFKLFCNYRI